MSVHWPAPEPDEIVRAHGAEANDNHDLTSCSFVSMAETVALVLLGGALVAAVLWSVVQ